MQGLRGREPALLDSDLAAKARLQARERVTAPISDA